jgi:hypothetical protein
MTTIEATLAQWEVALEILGLDAVSALRGLLGIDLECYAVVKETARRSGSRRRAGTCMRPDEITAPTWTDERGMGVEWARSNIRLRCGPNALAALEFWVLYVLSRSSSNPWCVYEDLVSGWASEYGRTGKDSLMLGEEANQFLISYQQCVSAFRITLEYREHEQSAWDARVYSSERELAAIVSFGRPLLFDTLELTVHMQAFQMFWRKAIGELSQDALRSIGAAARELANASEAAYVPPFCLPTRPGASSA